jgi:predicted nucleic acid-binding protein
MIVVDSSAAALLFALPDSDARVGEATRVLLTDTAWVVPEHWRVEFLSILRGLTAGGKMSTAQAENAVAWLEQIEVAVATTGPLLRRMWELRDNLSTYDAGYVAVAEEYGLTLVTADARIARAGVARCPVQVIR